MVRILAILGKYVVGCAVAFAMVGSIGGVNAASFKVLYSFNDGANCCGWPDGLIADEKGNLYGTTQWGGSGPCDSNVVGCGTTFEIASDGTATILHNFQGGTDGALPTGGRTRYKNNYYGTTAVGGEESLCPPLFLDEYGCGTVYKIAPDGTETILHAFQGGRDGANPLWQGLIVDKRGNLYGTTVLGGRHDRPYCYGSCGTVFKVAPDGAETVLYSFCSKSTNETHCIDGFGPEAGLMEDSAGNLYGTTGEGGAHGVGTVFSLAPDGTETVLYSFAGGRDGSGPTAGLISDGKGNLYGTTYYGGSAGCASGCGTVFKIAPDGSETVLYTFKGESDGAHPEAGLIADKVGNFYGTTFNGGGTGCYGFGCGTVFKLSPEGGETVLHAFSGRRDGAAPRSTLIADTNGNLYGTSNSTVFEIKK